MTEKELTFLVVLDDSKEIFNALRYAAQRSARANGRVALLYTFETLEFSHWKACLLYTSPSPRDSDTSRMPSSA